MHGYLARYGHKHGDIITHDSELKRNDFTDNNDIYWKKFDVATSFYQRVADEFNLRLPRRWVTMELFDRKYHRNLKFKDVYLAEPLGPTIVVDRNFDLVYLHGPKNDDLFLMSENWDGRARRFFMVNGSAAKALRTPLHEDRYGIICERWRLISLREANEKKV